jgi:hypothetical protein
MTASYWVLVADELLDSMDPSLLPDGLRLAEPPAEAGDALGVYPAHWHRFEDDNAPAELDGKRVELVLGRQGREGAKSVIIERRVLP